MHTIGRARAYNSGNGAALTANPRFKKEVIIIYRSVELYVMAQ